MQTITNGYIISACAYESWRARYASSAVDAALPGTANVGFWGILRQAFKIRGSGFTII